MYMTDRKTQCVTETVPLKLRPYGAIQICLLLLLLLLLYNVRQNVAPFLGNSKPSLMQYSAMFKAMQCPWFEEAAEDIWSSRATFSFYSKSCCVESH